jgi:chromatin structure-remodeling complex subunit RSC1/2
VLVVANTMEKASEPSQAQPTPEEPVQSIEDDGKQNGVTSAVTEEQWKHMMDVVLAIYEVREAE